MQIMIGGWDFSRNLTAAEVATHLSVQRNCVDCLTRAGRLVCTRTPGGHRRYSAQQIDHILAGGGNPDAEAAEATR